MNKKENSKKQEKGAKASEKTVIQWHPAFVSGLQLSLKKYEQELEYEQEHLLNKGPIRMDLLIIRKANDYEIDNDFARIFRKYNIIEYKNPSDALNIDILFKTIGYAALFKAQGRRVNEIPPGEVTITLVRHRKPLKLFKKLREVGAEVCSTVRGIYQVRGVILVQM